MSIASLNYFHSASLRQRYIAELDVALQTRRLRADERLWLQDAARPLVTGGPDPIRVDRLCCTTASVNAFELSGALMFSHSQTDAAPVYLYTLANGIEVFKNRHMLLNTLRARFAKGDADAVFEYELIEGDPFRAQMLAIVEHQVEHLDQLTAQLKLTPSLMQASTDSLARQLRETLPHMSIDPETHLLQIVPCSNSYVDLLPIAQTLADTVFDDYCKVQTVGGFERRFLNEHGLPADDAEAALFSQVLTDAVAGTNKCYEELLKTFWSGEWSDQRTRRDLAAETLENNLRRELYRLRHEGELSAAELKALLPLAQPVSGTLAAGSTLRCSRLTIKVGDSTSYALAGTFVVENGRDADPSLLCFSSEHRLLKFTDLAALATHFATNLELLRPTLAVQDQPILLREGRLQVSQEPIRAPLFADRVDSILALQARNLRYAMGLTAAPEEVTSMIDDALDVRHLLDPRQLQLSAGRWRVDAPFYFTGIWLRNASGTSISVALPDSANQRAEASTASSNVDTDASGASTASFLEYVQSFDSRADRLRQMDNMLLDYAEQALQRYLCVLLESPVRAKDVFVQWLESAPIDTSDVETHAAPVSESQRLVGMDLVSLLIECVSGHRPKALAVGAQVLFGSSSGTRHIGAGLVNHVLGKVTTNFIEGYLQRFKESRLQLQRQGDQQVHPARDARSIREDVVRLDLALSKRQQRIDSAAFSMARQVLDSPLRSLRMAQGVPMTEAFSVSLSYGNATALLCDTMVVRQPLILGSAVLLWACDYGWRQFTSVKDLLKTLRGGLYGPQRRRWLRLVADRDREMLQAGLLRRSDIEVQIRLDRLDGHAIEALQTAVLKREQNDLRQFCLRAVRCRFEAGLFARLANAIELDWPLNNMLDGLSVRIDNSIFEQMVPAWIDAATADDLNLYYEIFLRYYQASDGGGDFLFGIPSLQALTLDRLVARLSVDFPEVQWNPDQITVISRRYVSAFPPVGELPSATPAATIERRESLTKYAINRFVDAPDATLSVDWAPQPDAASLLTHGYLRRLVRELDVGAQYRALLRKAFTPDDANYLKRRRLFCALLPPALLAVALPEKVEGKLSAQGYEFITRVLDMPDGVAREPVEGLRVIISPLQLVADRGMAPDIVSGMYLICPADAGAGPVLLCALYNPDFVFREYADRAAVMDAIRADQSLQQLLMSRLNPEVHRRYARGGFIEPHLASSVGLFDFDVPLHRPGPVRLEIAEVKGNALQFLFSSAIKLLVDTGVSNSVTNEQVDQAGRSFLATLAVSQALSLLPSKVAAVVTLWQSHTLLRASVASFSGHRWGQALSEFTAALGVMVTARDQAIEEQPSADLVGPTLSVTGDEDTTPTFSWKSTSLTLEQRVRLQELEAQGVALTDMRHDRLLNLFVDKANGTPYAVVDGKVYQVRHSAKQGRWRIVGADGTRGPLIAADATQRWQLDLEQRLRGGGGMVTKVKDSIAVSSAEGNLVIEASGMPEIRLFYRDRARAISQAHVQARRYLGNCLDNLNASQRSAPLDPRVQQILSDFFGVANPDQELLSRVESAIKAMFDAVMDESLSPFSSKRFVVGSNRPGRDRVAAFVIPSDPQKRVFLTEQFFRAPVYRLKSGAEDDGFEMENHFRAAILLHELSHLVLDTKDIAYLESEAPYTDLLRANTAANLRIRSKIQQTREYRFSHRAQRHELFTRFEDGEWRDITAEDVMGMNSILRITGTTNLDQARTVFLADVGKRSQVMLKNADSVAMLITLLGRRNYAAPEPTERPST